MALFEMFAPQRKVGRNLGADIDLDALGSTLRTDQLLFSETGGFLLEVPEEKEQTFLSCAAENNMTALRIGATTQEAMLRVMRGQQPLLELGLPALLDTWKTALENHW